MVGVGIHSVIDVEAGAGLVLLDISWDADGRFRDKIALVLEEDLRAASVALSLLAFCLSYV